jgi:hypothetical protein
MDNNLEATAYGDGNINVDVDVYADINVDADVYVDNDVHSFKIVMCDDVNVYVVGAWPRVIEIITHMYR